MDIEKDTFHLHLKIGVIKELHKRQLITQKQMNDSIELINIDFKKQNVETEKRDEKSCGVL